MAFSFFRLDSQDSQKLMFCAENDAQKVLMKNNGIENVFIIYQGSFVNNDGLAVNKRLLERYINKYIPNKLDSGYGILDWEGQFYNTIAWSWNKVPPDQYKIILDKYIFVLKYVKMLRTKMKWSIYGIPPWINSTNAEDAVNLTEGLIPLIRELDFLCPSIYLLADGKTIEENFANKYFDANMVYAIKLAKQLRKPVYTCVWHRYSNNSLVAPTVYKKLINRINTTISDRIKGNGIIWWSCEDYLYTLNSKDSIIKNEYINVTDPKAYQMILLKNYIDSIKPLFNN